jgi:hypothetical protein
MAIKPGGMFGGKTMSHAGTIPLDKIRYGQTANEIVAIAKSAVGAGWTDDGCTSLVWGITNLAGAPFFDLRNMTYNGNPNQPLDAGYVVPHSAGVSHGSSNTAGDGYNLASSSASVATLKNILQKGDVVRLYEYGNDDESSFDGSSASAHSFIVIKNKDGNVKVVDNWTGDVVKHSFNDIVAAYAQGGQFESCFVSRLDEGYCEDNFPQNNYQGNGKGDWSSIDSFDGGLLSLPFDQSVAILDNWNLSGAGVIDMGLF